jgi:hypothetical protein
MRMTVTRSRLLLTSALTVLVAVITAGLSPLVGTAAVAAAPAASAAVTTSALRPMARPSYARTIPRASNVLRPFGRALRIYDQPGGRTLITLPNPLVAMITGPKSPEGDEA